MSTPTAATGDSAGDRIRWALADTWTITLRDLLHWRNRPGVVISNWLFPVLMMAMFVGLLGGALGESTDGSYINFVMPGILAMTMFASDERNRGGGRPMRRRDG